MKLKLNDISFFFESNIYDRMLKHYLVNSIISENQAKYLEGFSTVPQLLYIVHNIRKNWGYIKILQGLFIDISSAFNKVWHSDLLSKLSQI